jgi:hypothetical protein
MDCVCVCVCLCVCVCVRTILDSHRCRTWMTSIYMHAYIFTYVCIYVYVYIYIYICVCVCVCVCVYICIHTYIHLGGQSSSEDMDVVLDGEAAAGGREKGTGVGRARAGPCPRSELLVAEVALALALTLARSLPRARVLSHGCGRLACVLCIRHETHGIRLAAHGIRHADVCFVVAGHVRILCLCVFFVCVYALSVCVMQSCVSRGMLPCCHALFFCSFLSYSFSLSVSVSLDRDTKGHAPNLPPPPCPSIIRTRLLTPRYPCTPSLSVCARLLCPLHAGLLRRYRTRGHRGCFT